MSQVPLAGDFAFTGPVAIQSFRVRRQFADGDLVCSIIDWEMDPLPGTPAAAFRAIAERSVAALAAPGALERQYACLGTTVPGAEPASISLHESLIHGWDIATGAYLPYLVNDDIVHAVWQYAESGVGDAHRRAGLLAGE